MYYAFLGVLLWYPLWRGPFCRIWCNQLHFRQSNQRFDLKKNNFQYLHEAMKNKYFCNLHLIFLFGGDFSQRPTSINHYHGTQTIGVVMNLVDMKSCTKTYPMRIKNDYSMTSHIDTRLYQNKKLLYNHLYRGMKFPT